MDLASPSLSQGRASGTNIAFASKTVRGKSSGDDMETYSGYTSRSDGVSERTGRDFRFSDRGDLLHHETLYPDGAMRFADAQAMWQAVNDVERHPNAQFAYEVILPLTPDPDIGLAHNLAMIRQFADWYRVRRGVPVQIDVHSGIRDGLSEGADVGAGAATRANPHVHLLIPTRTLGPEGFGRKTRHLNPPFFRGRVMEEEHLRQVWSGLQQRYGEEHGLDIRIDPTGFVPQPHLGPPSCQKGRSELQARLTLVRQDNADAACNPAQVLKKLTAQNATFIEDDLDRLLAKHLQGQADAEEKIAIARFDVLASADLLAMNDKASGDWSGRYSTRQVRDQEQRAIDDATALSVQNGGTASVTGIHGALARRPLLINEKDQKAAFDHAVAPGKLKLIEGRAGTGKSYTLAAIREAFENPDEHGRPRKRVIGLSHLHVVKEDMKADGFKEVYTVARMLSLLEKTDGAIWNGVAMVAIDEAAMLSTAQFAGTLEDETPKRRGLLEWAERTGTKLVLVGDDRQLPSIERGGLFTELVERFGSSELTKVRRQREGWMREASQDLAKYDFKKAVCDYEADRKTASGRTVPGKITWRDTKTTAINALVDAWRTDSEAVQDGAPDLVERQFAFAYTNGDVDLLNHRLRSVRREAGKLGHDVLLDVCYREPIFGEAETLHEGIAFAVGDRIQFTRNDERQDIFNGNLATITGFRPQASVDGAAGWEVTALIDSARGKRRVQWNTADFNGIRHGYAGTGWKAQGKTIDRTYNLFSSHWTAPLGYMLLTRHREDARLFVASPDGARAPQWLAEQMARCDVVGASLAWNAESPPRTGDDGRSADVPIVGTYRQERGGAAAASTPQAAVPRAEIDIAFGRAQFRSKVAERQQGREQLGRDLVSDWDRRLDACRTALQADSADDRVSTKARGQLMASGIALVSHGWLPAMIRAQPFAFGLFDRPELQPVLQSGDVKRAVSCLIETLEKEQRSRDANDSTRVEKPRPPVGRAPRGR